MILGISVMKESETFAPALQTVDQTHSFLAKELTSTMVTSRLEEHKSDLTLFDDGHYFELIGDIPDDMDDIQCICAKTYADNGLCLISIYFEGIFYCILSDTNEDEPLLNTEFPDVSQEGDGITLGIYDENEDDNTTLQWRKLSVWQSDLVSEAICNSEISKNISLPANMYTQTYCILKPNKAVQSDRDVLFRFGSWCYTGNVELIENLKTDDIPHVIPALRIQQHKLAYLCDVSNMQEDNQFTEPMMYNTRMINELEYEILAVTSIVDNLRKRSDCDWLDDDPANIFFQFDSVAKNNSILTSNHIDLIATKSYRPNGLVVVTIYFDGTYYVCINDGDGDQPLLDSDFPCVVQGKGYQLKSYPNGLNSFPDLRKLSIWKNAETVDDKEVFHDCSAVGDEDPKEDDIECESKNDVEYESKHLQTKELSNSAQHSGPSSKDIEAFPHAQAKNTSGCNIHHSNDIDDIKQIKNDLEQIDSKDAHVIEAKHTEIFDEKCQPTDSKFTTFVKNENPSSRRKQNLGAFHHLAPLKKTSNLEEQMRKNSCRESKNRVPYDMNGQPLRFS